MEKKYYAKSLLKNGTQPTVSQHCAAVSEMAARFGLEINMEEAARLAGLLHDFGKYADLFQLVLKHMAEKIDHAFPGAVLLWLMKCRNGDLMPEKYRIVAEVINAHHDGLIAFGELKCKIENSVRSDNSIIANAGKTSSLAGEKQYSEAFRCFRTDFPTFSLKKLSMPEWRGCSLLYLENIRRMLLTRMLLSCLVDADYTVSASDGNEHYESESENIELDPHEKLKALYDHLDMIKDRSLSNEQVNHLRGKVFEVCGKAGEMAPGIFTLTAPTGTGKTLALLHFALRHMEKYHKKRIFIVLPFLTLTEQNTKVYRNIIPELLEDHSQNDLTDEQRIYTERWRVPMLITTSVRFFETLFSDKPTDCRKLHNIANSVIVFDEAQSLPADLIGATMTAIQSLCENYGCSMVFSTATQPEYASYPLLLEQWVSREILPEYPEYYQKLQRTEVDWRIDSTCSLDSIASEVAGKKSVCVIVNLRAHAAAIFNRLKELSKNDEVFYLTTDLCPAHRSKVIENIRERLQNGMPCRVVATQCIEAGVDLDFESVYRSLAPLDSIIQAAGRCNRSGRMQKKGQVVVFEPRSENGKRIYPDTWYQNAAETVKRLCMDRIIDIHDPEDIRRYYQSIFGRATDRQELRRAVEMMDYAKVKEKYRLINNSGVCIIVPYVGRSTDYDTVYGEIRKCGGITPKMIKMAADITVTIYADSELEKIAENIPLISKIRRQTDEDVKSRFYILRRQYVELYQKNDMGLQLKEVRPTTGFLY